MMFNTLGGSLARRWFYTAMGLLLTAIFTAGWAGQALRRQMIVKGPSLPSEKQTDTGHMPTLTVIEDDPQELMPGKATVAAKVEAPTVPAPKFPGGRGIFKSEEDAGSGKPEQIKAVAREVAQDDKTESLAKVRKQEAEKRKESRAGMGNVRKGRRLPVLQWEWNGDAVQIAERLRKSHHVFYILLPTGHMNHVMVSEDGQTVKRLDTDEGIFRLSEKLTNLYLLLPQDEASNRLRDALAINGDAQSEDYRLAVMVDRTMSNAIEARIAAAAKNKEVAYEAVSRAQMVLSVKQDGVIVLKVAQIVLSDGQSFSVREEIEP